MFLIGQGRHLAAEESFGLVVKPISCETGLKHHVLSAICAVTWICFSFFFSFFFGQILPLPPPCHCQETLSSSPELSSLTACHLNPSSPGPSWKFHLKWFYKSVVSTSFAPCELNRRTLDSGLTLVVVTGFTWAVGGLGVQVSFIQQIFAQDSRSFSKYKWTLYIDWSFGDFFL